MLALNVTVPLGKNSGTDVVGASETIAKGEVDATRGDLAQSVSQSTFNVVSNYWNYVAAVRNLAIAYEAEGGSDRRGRDVERLIAADRVPAAQRDLVSADVAAKRTSRISAEQAVTEARPRLSRSRRPATTTRLQARPRKTSSIASSGFARTRSSAARTFAPPRSAWRTRASRWRRCERTSRRSST